MPSPLPVDLQRPLSCTSDDDSINDHRSICSTEETRVRPLETSIKPRRDGSVRVAVRIRPQLPRELARNAATCVNKLRDVDNAIKVTIGATTERKFTFDHVFSQSTKQTELYDEVLHPWMTSFLQGFNVTVIAYGQTGAGKTYTMGNSMPSTSMMANSLFARSPSSDDSEDEAADTLDSDEGLIPRFLHHLFTKLNETENNFQLSVSFLEIYGEEIHDLLENSETEKNSKQRSEPLQLREDKKNGVWVQGLTEMQVSNRQEAIEMMQKGSLQRITASTQMNERSSRSHAVYTVKIVQQVSKRDSTTKVSLVANDQEVSNMKRPTMHAFGSRSVGGVGTDVSESDAVIVSKLTFVDLAGSERLKNTLAEGERMKEGIQINIGLFALGNVINALGDDKRRIASNVHVPYRSSKLTRLLQDALGGNSRTLFIVSPADLNANETLNTLQYANRAKNIQNKAVKNIDSRSAELANLKAFNQLLCRELVKAIVAGLKDGCPGDLDNFTDTCMTSPSVLAYLSRIERLIASTGLEASGDERTNEMRHLLNGLTTHLCELVPNNGYRQAASLTSLNEDKADQIMPPDENLDFVSDSGSSVTIMEERKPDSDDAFVTPYPLEKLCRTLEIMNFAFEMHELQEEVKRKRELSKAKSINLEARYHRQELLRNGLEWNVKQQQIDEMREAPWEATTNALSVMTRNVEIKVRFDSYDLGSILEYLRDEEKEMAAFVNEGSNAISCMSPLFMKEELSSLQARNILSMIQEQLRIAFDNEVLESSMNKDLRKRAQLLKNITTGLGTCHRGEMTEQEFMEKNEQNLKGCEDSISQIHDAMYARRGQRASMAEILDSIESLGAAKDLIRILIVEMYSRWRIYMVVDKEEKLRQQGEAEGIINRNRAAMKTDMDVKVENLEAKYEKDLHCVFQMVTSFNDAVRLEEREKMLVAQLMEREKEMTIMRLKLDQFQASAKSMERKEESLCLMSRCQKIWQELGLNEEDQTSRFQDVNEFVIKKCSEELEGLEAAREKIQTRISDAYRVVGRMEAVLHVVDPADIQLLPLGAGGTLLEQEKYMLSLQKRLSRELWGQVSARIRFSEGIRELALDLQIQSAEDFRHGSQEDLDAFDANFAASNIVELDVWKWLYKRKESADALDQLLDYLGGEGDMSHSSVQRDEHLYKILLKEKTKRIARGGGMSKGYKDDGT
ncbi:unnamed protein product [Peronospora destructor]|uniref:Kinesin motor domain-containing protein n=1 Tax=Peronospora destructor TaxID=86335 RepID=A0AAV0U9V9_9STRA|nr:unnamed protein product [Peronospora destructor]